MTTTIGIPYAMGEWTPEGIVRTCPVCNEKVLEPSAEYDDLGEYEGKDSSERVMHPYQMHYAVYHAGHEDE